MLFEGVKEDDDEKIYHLEDLSMVSQHSKELKNLNMLLTEMLGNVAPPSGVRHDGTFPV